MTLPNITSVTLAALGAILGAASLSADFAIAVPSENRPAIGPKDLEIVRDQPLLGYIAAETGLYVIKQNGETIQSSFAGMGQFPLSTVTNLKQDGSELLIGTMCCGVKRVSVVDGKVIDVASIPGMKGQSIRATHFLPTTNTAYVVTNESSYRSTDMAFTFEQLGPGLEDVYVTQLAEGPKEVFPIVADDNGKMAFVYDIEEGRWRSWEDAFRVILMTNRANTEGLEISTSVQEQVPMPNYQAMNYSGLQDWLTWYNEGDRTVAIKETAINSITQLGSYTFRSTRRQGDSRFHAAARTWGGSDYDARNHAYLIGDDGLYKVSNGGETLDKIADLPTPPAPKGS